MNKILELLVRYFSFLYDDFGARFVDSLTGSMGSALVVLEKGDVRLRFINDRGKIYLEFQSTHSENGDDWFSLDVVRQLIVGGVDDDDILWGTIDGDPETDYKKAARSGDFVKAKFAEIADAFSKLHRIATEKTLHGFEEARGKRLFG